MENNEEKSRIEMEIQVLEQQLGYSIESMMFEGLSGQDLDEIQLEQKSLRDKIQNLKNRIDDLQRAEQEIQSDFNSNIETNFEPASEPIANQPINIEKMEEEISQLKSEIEEAKKEVTQKWRRALEQRSTGQYPKIKEEMNEIAQEIMAKNQRISDLQQQINVYVGENMEESAVQKEGKDKEMATQKSDTSIEEKISILYEECGKLAEAFNKAQKENSGEKIEELLAKLHDKQEELSKLRAELEKKQYKNNLDNFFNSSATQEQQTAEFDNHPAIIDEEKATKGVLKRFFKKLAKLFKFGKSAIETNQ